MASKLPNGWPRGEPLPKGWTSPLLSKIAHRASGHTPDKAVPSYWNGGIKWLSLADCDRLNKVYVADTTHSISDEGIKHSSACLLPAGVVVLSRDAGVGQSGITTTPMAVSQHFLAWQCSDALSPLFLYYWFQFIRLEFERVAVGSTIKTIGLRYFDKMRVPLPSFGQQASFVSAMLSLDEMKTQISELIRTKRKLLCGLTQQLLTGKKRFHGFQSQPWSEVRLSDCVKPVKRKNDHGCTRVLTASGEHGLVDQRRYFNRRVAAADLSGYYVLRRGEFAYNRSAMNGYPYGAIKRLDAHEEGALSTLYLCFAVDDESLDHNFLRHVFESGLLNKQLRRIVRVGSRAHGLLNVSDSDFFSASIPLPELDEQRAIATVLDGLEREIDLLNEQRGLYEQYKRGLMSRLLSGDIQVPA